MLTIHTRLGMLDAFATLLNSRHSKSLYGITLHTHTLNLGGVSLTWLVINSL